jgi:hypothetical protein
MCLRFNREFVAQRSAFATPGFMHLGKTLFAQAMDFLPKTFPASSIDTAATTTRSLSCAEQFRVMAFAQLTYCEACAISKCVGSSSWQAYHMGSRGGRRSRWPMRTSRATGAFPFRVGSTADHQGSRAHVDETSA